LPGIVGKTGAYYDEIRRDFCQDIKELMMIDVPINAKVECTDGSAGQSTSLIINPTTRMVTNVVVETKGFPRPVERLVPIELVVETTQDRIRLRCTKAELAEMDPFVETQFITTGEPESGVARDYAVEPFATTEAHYIPVDFERVPPGELVVRRGAQVEASDGHIGQVGEFVLDPDSGQITHLVLLEGHTWGKQEVTLPISAIDHMGDMTVYLKLDKAAIASLPVIPIKRHYTGGQDTNVEVVAAAFDKPDGAEEQLNYLKELEKEKVFKIRNSAILVKGQDGETTVKESDDVGPRRGTIFGAISGGLIGLVAGPIGAVIGAVAGAGTGRWAARRIDMGFSDESLQKLEESLQPGGSALVVLVEHSWKKPMPESLADMDGLIFHQVLTDEQVNKMVAGAKPAVDNETDEQEGEAKPSA
jgi:uncharacterized membrane protein